MKPELKVLIYEEKNILKELLDLLDSQYELIFQKDIVKIDTVAKELDNLAKELAKLEIQRRNIVDNEISMKKIIDDCDDQNIKLAYKEIKSTLNMIEIQKEANTTLIKQKLFFTGKMINCIKPNKKIGVYDSYGQISK